MKRREFLLGGLAAPWLSACASLQNGKPRAWSDLRTALDGDLLLPDDAAFEKHRKLFNSRFDDIRPSALARCKTVEDVRACLAFARRNSVPIHPRSGGHSYAGWSTGPGLVIDVSQMNEVTVAAGSTVATVGAGAQLIDVYDRLAAHGRTLPGGSCPTVGIAGFTLGGGISMLGRAYGLGCDSLTQVEVVTAGGDIVTCDAARHPDLFWACRGGGGGNFGIATSLQFRTQPLKNITTARLEWDWAFAARVIRSWQKWGPAAPDEAFSICGLRANPAGPEPGVRINIIFLGEAAGLEPLLGDLIGAVGAEPTRAVRTMEGLYALRTLAGCPTVTIQQCHLSLVSEEGTVARQAHVGKSTFFDRPLSDTAINTAILHIERARATPGLRQGSVLFDALGGAVGRVRPDETAFVHRGALFSCQFLAYWQENADLPTAERSRSWMREFHSAMLAESTGGAYVNYTDPELRGWQRAYYGSNYERLVRVKAAYDPDWLFKLPQGIPVG